MRIIDIIFSSINRVRVSRPPLFSLLFSLFSSRSQGLDKFLFVIDKQILFCYNKIEYTKTHERRSKHMSNPILSKGNGEKSAFSRKFK